MKKLITLSLSLVLSCAYAQSTERVKSKKEQKLEERLQYFNKPAQKGQSYKNKSAGAAIHRLDSLTFDEMIGSTLTAYDKEVYYYDAAGNDTLYYWLEPDGNGGWDRYFKGTQTFNSSNQVLVSIEYDPVGTGWEPYWKSDNTYNASGNITSSLGSEYNAGTTSWMDAYKTTYTYNASGDLIEELEEWMNTGQWENDYKTNYTYNATGQLTNKVSFYWGGTQWDSSSYGVYTYTATTQRSEEFYFDGSSWVNDYAQTTTFDASGNLTEMLSESWDGSAWENDYRETATYDLTVSLADLMMPDWLSFLGFVNKPLTLTGELWNGTSWDADGGLTLYYSNPSVGIQENVISVAVFPNPATNNITFDLANSSAFEVAVINMNGQKVLVETLDANQKLDVSALPRGTYIYEVTTGETKQTGKIVLK